MLESLEKFAPGQDARERRPPSLTPAIRKGPFPSAATIAGDLHADENRITAEALVRIWKDCGINPIEDYAGLILQKLLLAHKPDAVDPRSANDSKDSPERFRTRLNIIRLGFEGKIPALIIDRAIEIYFRDPHNLERAAETTEHVRFTNALKATANEDRAVVTPKMLAAAAKHFGYRPQELDTPPSRSEIVAATEVLRKKLPNIQPSEPEGLREIHGKIFQKHDESALAMLAWADGKIPPDTIGAAKKIRYIVGTLAQRTDQSHINVWDPTVKVPIPPAPKIPTIGFLFSRKKPQASSHADARADLRTRDLEVKPEAAQTLKPTPKTMIGEELPNWKPHTPSPLEEFAAGARKLLGRVFGKSKTRTVAPLAPKTTATVPTIKVEKTDASMRVQSKTDYTELLYGDADEKKIEVSLPRHRQRNSNLLYGSLGAAGSVIAVTAFMLAVANNPAFSPPTPLHHNFAAAAHYVTQPASSMKLAKAANAKAVVGTPAASAVMIAPTADTAENTSSRIVAGQFMIHMRADAAQNAHEIETVKGGTHLKIYENIRKHSFVYAQDEDTGQSGWMGWTCTHNLTTPDTAAAPRGPSAPAFKPSLQ